MKKTLANWVYNHATALIAAAVAAAFIYFFTRHSGIGISPDSVVYQSTATNIKTHFSFTDFNGLPTVDFPLGYPCFLAIGMLVSGLSVLSFIPVLNVLLLSAVILLTSIILNGFTQTSSVYKTAVLSVLACSPFLLEVYSMLWSETLFVFWVLLFMVALHKYQETATYKNLFIAAIIAALAFVTRYAGITVLATGAFFIVMDGRLALVKKTKHLLLFAITGSSLVVINLLRNHFAAGHSTGVREKAIRTVWDNLNQIGGTLGEWLPFIRGQAGIQVLVLGSLLILSSYRLISATRRQEQFHRYETIINAYFLVYAGFMVVISSISRFEDLTSRLLSPMYIPMLLVGSNWMVGVIRQSGKLKKWATIISGLVLFAGFHYNHYHLNAEAWEGIKDAGIPGYTEDSWVQSPTIAYLKKNKTTLSGTVFANANDAVYFLNGIHAGALPHKDIPSEINAFLQKPAFWLIWLQEGENPDLVSLDFIKQHKRLLSEKILEDGALYYFADSTAEPAQR